MFIYASECSVTWSLAARNHAALKILNCAFGWRWKPVNNSLRHPLGTKLLADAVRCTTSSLVFCRCVCACFFLLLLVVTAFVTGAEVTRRVNLVLFVQNRNNTVTLLLLRTTQLLAICVKTHFFLLHFFSERPHQWNTKEICDRKARWHISIQHIGPHILQFLWNECLWTSRFMLLKIWLVWSAEKPAVI